MGSHTTNMLTVKSIAANKSAKLRDGGGLYLITRGENRYWILSFTFGGKRREMGIGPLREVGLAEARDRARAARELIRNGVDPIEKKRADQAPKTDIVTFGKYADSYVDAAVKAGRWRGAKTEARWRNMLTNHAASIRNKPISEIVVSDVLAALRPVWGEKQETAEKLRETIERVLDSAKVEGHRIGENPAAWKGNLEHVLHKPDKVSGEGHHAAMPYQNARDFLQELRNVTGVGARALEFTVLTAARSGETRGAVWTEINLKEKIWSIPAGRMKGGKAHRVPLSKEAIAILTAMKARAVNDLVFPGVRDNKPLSDMSLAKALKSAGASAFTVHGFRSTFRDWATEVAHAPREIAEASLAHAVGDAVERSYARSDALERRRTLMQEWSSYLC